ncbi:GumC family protein [Winogradskyella thalassocola]|uniref:non-specific protein-tyrosine kinase n=1 Tax=Winogradskyella thalassocola TaxID=262004 RepID=A0A1G7Z2I0_9FLAO|nr:polysaccharide biosynthesis tyrosine autokinase [Winogradskyella thalassocola]SDH02706.1 capsular exopolysaccharide family [Winogradskyella thalassocola]
MSQIEVSNYQKSGDQGEFIKREIRKYLQYWYWFALGVVLALIGAFIYLRYTPKVYSASAKIKILNKTKGLELPSSAFIFNRSNINLENEIEILKSYRIIENVVDRLDLTMRFFEEGSVLTTEIHHLPFNILKTISNDSIFIGTSYKIEVKSQGFEVIPASTGKAIVFPNFDSTKTVHNLPFELSWSSSSVNKAFIGKTYIVKFAPIASVTGGLKGGVSISMLGKGSDLLQLSYTSQSKAKNERILNTLIEVFNEDGINDRQDISRRTIDFIDERFKLIEKELDSIEFGIKDYKEKNNLITLESDAELGITQRTLSEEELFETENQLILSTLLKETLEKPNPNSELLPANIGVNNASINGLVNNYNTLVLERDNLIVSAGERNPNVVLLKNRLQDLKSNIFASIDSYAKQLEASKAQLMRKNKKFASQVYSLPGKEKKITDITRQREIKQTLYLFLLQKREEAAINLAITEPSIKVVEYAISGGAPISPNSRSTYLIAFVLGLLLPFGGIYASLLLDTKIKGREDLLQLNTKVPIVGELPKVKSEQLIFSNPEDNSAQSEAFRILSSNVNYILPLSNDNKGKVIYCTSTIKGEGKTYVSINLSLALSSINKKVLLIGADLRNPQIHTHIAQDKHKPGLSNYLHDINYDWRDALISGFEKHPNHQIILSGSIPPNPAHLLTNGRFTKLLEEAKDEYDYIIVDTAPTILVTDTMLISQLADATIYLTRANYTEKNLLKFSKDLSESGKLKNMAYVINSVGASRSYGYGYNYGYNYGYGNKES